MMEEVVGEGDVSVQWMMTFLVNSMVFMSGCGVNAPKHAARVGGRWT